MSTVALNDRRILVVDSDAAARETVGGLLTSAGASVVIPAASGEDAVALSRTSGIVDLVIAEIGLPVMNGLELLKFIRMGRCGLDRATPFVILTSYGRRSLVDLALNLDVGAFLLKPVGSAALARRVNQLIVDSGDRDWLKAPEIYDAMDTKIGMGPHETVLDVARPHAAPDDAFLSDAPVSEAPLSEATPDPDPEPVVIEGLSLLRGAAADPLVAAEIAVGMRDLVAETGQKSADRLLKALDGLERSGTLSLRDIAGLVKPDGRRRRVAAPAKPTRAWRMETRALAKIPPGAVSADHIKTRDGKILIARGTGLFGPMLRILRYLERLGVLDVTGSVRIKLPAPGTHKDVQTDLAVASSGEWILGPTEIRPGIVTSRDIVLVSGAIFLRAGTMLTERHVDQLGELYELGKLTSKVRVSG